MPYGFETYTWPKQRQRPPRHRKRDKARAKRVAQSRHRNR